MEIKREFLGCVGIGIHTTIITFCNKEIKRKLSYSYSDKRSNVSRKIINLKYEISNSLSKK